MLNKLGQITPKLRKTTHGFAWYCPGCEEMHPLPFERGWTFDGNLDAPTFTPSFKHELTMGPLVKPPKREGVNICHYIITAGQVAYCGDCTHSMAGKTIPMPDLPIEYQDAKQ